MPPILIPQCCTLAAPVRDRGGTQNVNFGGIRRLESTGSHANAPPLQEN
jgi:hypothetical protein